MRYRISCLVLLVVVGGIPGLVNSGLAGQTNRSLRGGRSADTEHEIDKVVLGTNLVSVNTTVKDKYDRLVIGISKDRFEVYDNNVKQEIAHFTDDDFPVSPGIIYDVSGSMKGRIGRSLDALKRFLDTSHQDDEFFLVGFNNRASLLQDFTSSADRIIGHLMMVAPKGSTALYDAAYLAIEKIRQGRLPKKALLIISDGQDNGFNPSDVTGPARWHKIKIKINPPKGLGRLAVSYRDGYPSFNSPVKSSQLSPQAI